MKKWIQEKTTIVGLVLMAMAALQAYRTGGDMVSAAMGASALVGFFASDRKKTP